MNLSRTCLMVALGFCLAAAQGCALFVVAAVAGAAGGTVSYAGNELRVTQEVSVEKAWSAAQATVRDLRFSVIAAETHHDATGGMLSARNAKDQPVRIQLVRQSDRLTEIRVRVGTFDTTANRAGAQLVYDKLRERI